MIRGAHPRIECQMQPILLKGHERSITAVKFNSDGDLLFSSAKDSNPTLWSANTGERLGVYENHKGAVLDLDPSWDSKYLLTAGADGNARLFEITGKFLAQMTPGKGAIRVVSWSESNTHFAVASDFFSSRDNSLISFYRINPSEIDSETSIVHLSPYHQITVPVGDKTTCLSWGYANQYLIAGFDSGVIIKFNPETGEEISRSHTIHTQRIHRLNFNTDKTLLVSCSDDCTAKLIDPYSLQVLRVYQTDVPVNGAVISPTHPHVIMGGGQEAMKVTTTSASQGKFESRFFHMVYGEEFGRVKGHFGPINDIAVHPFGKSFASASEDGYIRLHFFPPSYLETPDFLPEDLNLMSVTLESASASAVKEEVEGEADGDEEGREFDEEN